MAAVRSTIEGWDALFYPSSIAVVGGTDDLKKPGGIVLENLKAGGFTGAIYPVNPGRREIKGLKCYPDLATIPGQVDLAVVAVKSHLVLPILEECSAMEIRAAIIFSSGFGEVDEAGLQAQDRIREMAADLNMRICGPNTMGMVNYLNKMHSAFVYGYKLPNMPDHSDNGIALICQSGGVGCSILQACHQWGLDVAAYVCTGNEAATDFSDYLAYFTGHPEIKMVASYMEGILDGRKFALAAEAALAAGKPVVILKSGTHEASARAARSHTGALAGSASVYRALFRQKGIIDVQSIGEMAAVLSLLATGRRPAGKGVAIVASSGGQAVIAADKFSGAGLELVQLSTDIQNKIARELPPFAGVGNPVDLTGLDIVIPGLFQRCASAASEDTGVGTVVLSHWLNQDIDSLGQLKAIAKFTDKPLALLSAIPGISPRQASEDLVKYGVAFMGDADIAATALAKVVKYTEKVKSNTGHGTCCSVPAPVVPARCRSLIPGSVLAEREVKELLASCGIAVVPELAAATADEAVAAAQKLGYPVAVKVDSPDIIHKTEVDGIRLNLSGPEEVRQAFSSVTGQCARRQHGALIRGVLVQKMMSEGQELLVGISRDPVFGPVLTFGMGGIWVEILKDISMRVLPVCADDVREMIRETKAYSILAGARGKAALDLPAVEDILLKVVLLAENWPELAELDINPLIVLPEGHGAFVVDAMAAVAGDNQSLISG
ncbi:MAG: acetate--CoA ligase family protein [Bacillota bacterium]